MNYLYISIGAYFLVWTFLATVVEVKHKKDAQYNLFHFLSFLWPFIVLANMICIPLHIAKFIGNRFSK